MRGKIKKLFRSGIAGVLAFVLLSSTCMPMALDLTGRLQNEAAMQEILNADLSEYEGERVLSEEILSELPEQYKVPEGEVFSPSEEALPAEELDPELSLEEQRVPIDAEFLEQEELEPQEYQTNRFIVKYKDSASTASVAQVEQRLKRADVVADVVEMAEARSAVASVPAELKSLSVLTTQRAVSLEALQEELSTDSERQIEYIQPDYELQFFSLEEELAALRITGEVARKLQEATAEEELATEVDLVEETNLLAEGELLPTPDYEAEPVLEEPAPTPWVNLPRNNVVVALLDTGVDTDHPELAGRVLPGYDFVNDRPSANDPDNHYDQGHGTSLAGIIAASGATVLPLKVFEGGKAYTSDIIAAISYAQEQGATIANLSFGGRYENRALEEAMEASSLLFVVASGNLLVNIDNYPVYPAAFGLPNQLTVASVGVEDRLSRFSNYGPETVELAALGEDVPALWFDDQVITNSGTSYSAAVVSAAAARVQAAKQYRDALELKARLMESADTVTGLQDKLAGGKRLNVEVAISTATGPNTTVIDVPDDEPLPEISLDGPIEEDDYEEYGADGLVTSRTPMPTAREGLKTIAVGKKIYAIGGQMNSTYYNKVEIYDTQTDTWTTGANMTYGVSYFASAVIGTNIYCIGGFDGSYRNYVQVYSTTSNSWSTKTVLPYSPMGAAAVEYNGKIYVSGGQTASSTFRNYVYEYNPTNNAWTSRGNLLSARAYHNAFIYYDKMYVDGGLSSSTTATGTEEQYDLSNFIPTNAGPSRTGVNSGVALRGHVLITVGNSHPNKYSSDVFFIMLNFAPGSYTKKLSLPSAIASAGVEVVDNNIYIIGGKNSKYIFQSVNVIESGYKIESQLPKHNKWFETAFINGELYMFGGYDSETREQEDVWAYNTNSKQWIKKADLPEKERGKVVPVYGKLYAFLNNNIYKYDPKTNIWSGVLATIPNAFRFSDAIAINGKIYLIPGRGSTIQIYDPLLNDWAIINPLPDSFGFLGAAAIGHNLYIIGYDADSSKVYRLDTSLGVWTNHIMSGTGYWPYASHNYASVYNDIFFIGDYTDGKRRVTRLSTDSFELSYYNSIDVTVGTVYHVQGADNKVFLFASGRASGSMATLLAEYTPYSSPWLGKSYLSYGSVYMGSAAISNKLYLVGGEGWKTGSYTVLKDLEEYSFDTNQWSNKAGMQYARTRPASAVVNGKIYVIGGMTTLSGTTTYQVEEYNTSTNTWATKARYPSYNVHSAASAVYDGKIYVFGGRNGTSGAYNYVYEYNPSTNVWTTKTAMPTARYGAGAVTMNGKVYVVGGFNSSNTALTTLEVYDPATNSWDTTKRPLPEARAYAGVVGDNGLYVLGGTDGYSQSNSVYQYNPVVDKWFYWYGMDHALEGCAAEAINNGIMVVNGVGDVFVANSNFATTAAIADNNDLLHLGSDIINPSGNLSRSYTDLSYNAPGFNINVGRTYNSIDDRAGPISAGWSFSFASKFEEVGNDTVIRMPDGSARTFRVNSNGTTYTAKDSRSTLTKSGTTYLLTTADYYKYRYNATGFLYEMEDPNGNKVVITVDSSGKVTKITDQVGRAITVGYNTSGQITTITDPAGRTVSYTYTSGRLSRVTGPDGNQTNYAYTAVGDKYLLSSVKNHSSVEVEAFTYEIPAGSQQARVKTVKLPAGATETYTYDKMEGLVSITSGTRSTKTYYDKALYPILSIDAEGGETRTEYHLDSGINRYGEVRSVTDRNGNSTFYDRDSLGNITRIVYPDQSTRQYEYHTGTRDIKTGTDERGYKTHYTYDSYHNLTKKFRPINGTGAYTTSPAAASYLIESYTYADSGTAKKLLKTATDTDGNQLTYNYDTYGNPTTVSDLLSRTTTYSYNKLGWLKSKTTPKGNTTNTYYDMAGRVVKQVEVQGTSSTYPTTRYYYDTSGFLKEMISPKIYDSYRSSDTVAFTTENIVSSANTQQITNVGTRYTTNNNGQVLTQTNALGHVVTNTYDTFGNLLTEKLPVQGTAYLFYVYTYDKINRVLTKKYYTSASSTQISLEAATYTTLSSGNTKQTTTAYFTSSSTASTVCEYDFAGRLVKQTNPDGGIVEKTYLPGGLLSTSKDAMGGITYYEYTPLGRKSAQWAPHSGTLYSLTTWTYNSKNQLSAEKQYIQPRALALGSTASGDASTRTYTYFTDGAIATATTNGAALTSYTYDSDGNRDSVTTLLSTGRSSKTEYTYNYLGKVATEKVYHEKKDLYGQTETTDQIGITTSYLYDKNGNLTDIAYPNGASVINTYDSLNRQSRQTRTVNNENNAATSVYTEKTYDSMGNILTERDEKGNVTTHTYTILGSLETTVDAMGGTTYRATDYQGRLTKLITPQNYTGASQANNTTSYAYDTMGRLLTKKEVYLPYGTATAKTVTVQTNTYDKNGNLLTSKNALNQTTTMTYDKGNRLATQKDPLNKTASFAYDARGKLTQQTDARGVSTVNTYDLYGNLTGVSVAGITTMTATYDLAGNQLTLKDGKNNTVTNEYTLLGQLSKTTNPAGYWVRARYDNMGNQAYSLDSLGKRVVNTYDLWSRLQSSAESTSAGAQTITVSMRYDVLGNLRYVVDGRGKTTETTYDALNRQATVKNALNQTTTFAYDKNGNRTGETNWRGNATIAAYDPLGRLCEPPDANGNRVELLTYDDANRQLTSADALGNTTTFAYDACGRLLSTKDAENYVVSQTYDAVGNVLTKTDGNGKVTSYAYNDRNLLTKVTDAAGHETGYAYDNAGNLTDQTDGNGNLTRLTYNNLNLVSSRSAGGLSETITYRPDGSLLTRTDRNGSATTADYDIHGRVLSERTVPVEGSVITSSYTYDNNGNLLTETNADGIITRTYDNLGRVLTKSVPGFSAVTFAYDLTTGLSAGHIGESSTVDGRTTQRVVDKAGRLVQVKEGSDTTSYTYYDNGNLNVQTLPNNATATYTYYKNNRLKTLQNKNGGTTLEAYSYTYDGAGNMTAKQDRKGTTGYTYTVLSQLRTVTESSGRVTSYTYDGAGNRLTEKVVKDGQTAVTSYEVDNLNRLVQTVEETSVKTETNFYSYDDAGNLLSHHNEILRTQPSTGAEDSLPALGLMVSGLEESALSYDLYETNARSQLVRANSSGKVVESSFGEKGYRSSKTSDGVTTRFLYEGDRILVELDSDGGSVYNGHGLALISREVNGEKHYYLYNGHGDVTVLLSATGALVAQYYYDAFGVITEQTGSVSNPYRYSGYYYDWETKLYDLKARFYDAKLARFLQEDTYYGKLQDPLSLNLYTYCFNNPLIYWDPSGHVVTDWDKAHLSSDSIAKIEKATKDWETANAKGNEAGKAAAHATAEAERNKARNANEYGSPNQDGNTVSSRTGGVSDYTKNSGSGKSESPGTSTTKDTSKPVTLEVASVTTPSNAASTGSMIRPAGSAPVSTGSAIEKQNLAKLIDDQGWIRHPGMTDEEIYYVNMSPYSDGVSRGTAGTEDLVDVDYWYPLSEHKKLYQDGVNHSPGYYAATYGAMIAGDAAKSYSEPLPAKERVDHGKTSEGIQYGSDTKSAEKLGRQMDQRGWTKSSVAGTVDNPYTTRASTNLSTNNPSTVYYNQDGSYVIIDNVTKGVVQVSDAINPTTWIPDPNIVNPYIPK